MVDHINPDHYKVGGIETIDFIESKLTAEQFKGYCLGNVLKYVSRAGHKGSETFERDLNKALWYLARAAGKGDY